MARFLQAASRRAFLLSSLCPQKLFLKGLSPPPLLHPQHNQARNYIAEMRKSAFEGNILRILRTEIQYELEYAPPKQPVAEFNSFVIEDKPGEQWIQLRGKYGEKEEIKLEVTMFDGSVPAPRPGDDDKDDEKLHMSLIVDVSKGESCKNVMQFICSVWPDSMEIQKVFMLERDQIDLDDELQDSLNKFLEERGITDDLAAFLHEYMVNKDKLELIRWLGIVKSYIEK
ncbi:hypothetical protein ACLOJK_002560 [Asimina triloba]